MGQGPMSEDKPSEMIKAAGPVAGREDLERASGSLNHPADPSLVDSRYAAWRLAVALVASTLGNAAMYSLAVAIPEVQRDFGGGRGEASLAYAAMMAGLAAGGYLCGRWADRYGIARVVVLAGLGTLAGFVVSALSPNLIIFSLAHCLLLGFFGIGGSFVPLIADTSLWWKRRRGVAVAVVASGNFAAGTVWPPIAQWGIDQFGWRPTFVAMGLICGLGMVILAYWLRQRPPLVEADGAETLVERHGAGAPATSERLAFGLPLGSAQALLFLAAVGCCVAMAMPQVHIVAYCTDLGFSAARGAEMLSLMLGFGIVSRLASGWISDHIGGLRTLLLGSALQMVALFLFLPFDSLVSLYVTSALFGLFQGGIVSSYAIVVREYFPAQEAGARTGAVLVGGQVGMALGGWMSGKVFDLTGSYHAAFINGIGWNLINLAIIIFLLLRLRGGWHRAAPA
jgi:MFS family permease